MPTGKVIGFLHADRLYSGCTVDEIDRGTVWAFAEGFGYAYERTVLLERMRRQHAKVDLRKVEPAQRSTAARSLVDINFAVSEVLTRREVAVLRLMAAGRTNHTSSAFFANCTTEIAAGGRASSEELCSRRP